jgi:tRNA (guanine37-N1)-methyltransferase
LLILICGRYEGVDERVAEHLADEVISIGDYVLSGGELPAAVTLEAICRFLPGFIGNQESLEEIHGSIPVYTRPAVFRTSPRSRPWIVPNVLLSGNHADIATWRKRHQKPTR